MTKPKPTPRHPDNHPRRARKPTTPALVGRPRTPYDEQLGVLILEEMAKGEKSLYAICKDNGFPDRSVIYRWVLENREFAALFAQARDIQQHSSVDHMRYLADTVTAKTKAKVDLQIGVIKWQAGRLLPRVYGDSINHDHTLTPPPVNADLLSRLTPDEREAVRTILTAAMAREERQQPGLGQGLVLDQRRDAS